MRKADTGILVPNPEDWPGALEAAVADATALRAQGRKARDGCLGEIVPEQML